VSRKPKLVIGITSALSTPLIAGQGRYFVDQGYDVYILGPKGGKIEEYCETEGCTHLPVPIARDISLFSDLRAFLVLFWWMIRIQPDIVNVGTPKMGFLGSMSAFLTRIPRRIYTCRGLRYESEFGRKRKFLMFVERVCAVCAQSVVCVSQSVQDQMVADGICKREKTVVIGRGSSNGIDVQRFARARIDRKNQKIISSELGLDGNFVIGFVGRLAERKGVAELYSAFKKLRGKRENVKLVLLGVLDRSQFPDNELLSALKDDDDVSWVGFQDDVPSYMSTFDVLVLPSWWEGFPSAPVQAAAMEVPVISTDANGCRDATKHDFNGLIVPPKDPDAIYGGLLSYYDDVEMRLRHGRNGRAWAESFDSQTIWSGLDQLYRERG
jgi:glycosyltransferase involved in cell wall biosynthesis